jgi:16S rRNA (cytosine1402-N4)-methyltransferase
MSHYDHHPCMLSETLQWLAPRPGQLIIDSTVGCGGHAVAILNNSAPTGKLIGIDQDAEMLAGAEQRLAPYGDRVSLFHANFTQLPEVMIRAGVEYADGILLDAGLARPQFIKPEYGIGFSGTTLDMRLDPGAGTMTAHELLNTADERELRDILRSTQTARESRQIARAICSARQNKPIETSAELANIITQATGAQRSKTKRQPASAMLAIRIHVNREIENLEEGLELMVKALRPESGRLITISYHSLEFRTMRRVLEQLERGHDVPPWLPEPSDSRPLIRRLFNKPLKPLPSEPRTCRSARLFAVEALPPLSSGERVRGSGTPPRSEP